MADSLPTLIKLAEYRVEQAQMKLAAAQKAEDAARATLVHWQNAGFMGYQTAIQGDDITQLANAGQFLFKAKQEEEKAQQALTKQQQETTAARTVLTEAFGTQKRYELLHERHKLAARKTLQKKQQANLEDVTSQKRR